MLEEALRLQAEGWSLNRLGAKFRLDPKTMKRGWPGSELPAPLFLLQEDALAASRKTRDELSAP